MTNAIQCTRDSGRVHLSYEGLSIDSIDSYNNWFTKLFAWMFGWSVSVTINSKTYSLDKQDYASWINSHTDRIDVTKAITHEFANFCSLQVRRPSANASPIRHALSQYKQESLYYKLVKSMHNSHDFEGAKKYLYKGAGLNYTFWSREQFGLSFTSMKAGLGDCAIKKTTMNNYSPLLYAATYGKSGLCNEMLRLGANPNITGSRVEFKRKLQDVQTNTTLEPTVDLVRTNYRGRGGRKITTYHNEAHLDVRTKTTAQFVDVETTLGSHVFSNNQVLFQPLANPKATISAYVRTVDEYRNRLL